MNKRAAAILKGGVLLLLLTAWAAVSDLIGRASVIDGDTIEIHGQRVRLHGVDAPESVQLCEADGQQYRCGQRAALALADRIGTATVSCEPRDIDRYRRIVAVCSVAGDDLGAWLVRQGWALAYREYSTDYVAEEYTAQAAGVGILGRRLRFAVGMAADAARRYASS